MVIHKEHLVSLNQDKTHPNSMKKGKINKISKRRLQSKKIARMLKKMLERIMTNTITTKKNQRP